MSGAGGGEVTRLNKVIYLEQSSSVSAVCGGKKLSPLEICNNRLSFLAKIKEGIRDLRQGEEGVGNKL